jgi:hypothetical protein
VPRGDTRIAAADSELGAEIENEQMKATHQRKVNNSEALKRAIRPQPPPEEQASTIRTKNRPRATPRAAQGQLIGLSPEIDVEAAVDGGDDEKEYDDRRAGSTPYIYATPEESEFRKSPLTKCISNILIT